MALKFSVQLEPDRVRSDIEKPYQYVFVLRQHKDDKTSIVTTSSCKEEIITTVNHIKEMEAQANELNEIINEPITHLLNK